MTDDMPHTLTDTLTEAIGVLTRREVEARILAPLIAALCARFGEDAVLPVVRETIIAIAREQGAALARANGDSADAFADTLCHWTRDNALEIEVIERGPTRLHFDVTRCRYAEMYRALGIEDLGALLSCNRDNALIEGFNPAARLERAQTILGGAPRCTFRYEFPAPLED